MTENKQKTLEEMSLGELIHELILETQHYVSDISNIDKTHKYKETEEQVRNTLKARYEQTTKKLTVEINKKIEYLQKPNTLPF